MNPRISIVIPTWQGADVIGDAIECAQAQSFGDLEIIVSVDKGNDETAALAREASTLDSRVQVTEHPERLGWVRNVNSALDSVAGELFVLYFHDDLIHKDYLLQLFSALEKSPSAMSAYCAVEQDSGEKVFLDRGRTYEGEAFQRMLDRLLLPQAGAPLRGLTRRRVLDEGLRFPEGSQQGFHAQHAYLFDLIGSADSVYVDLPLYRRRNWRPGALTKGWSSTPGATLAEDLQIVSRAMLRVVDSLLTESRERELVSSAIALRLLSLLRGVEVRQRCDDLMPLSELVPPASIDQTFPDRWSKDANLLRTQIEDLEMRWHRNASSES